MDKGILSFSCFSPFLMLVATYIIFPGELNEIAVDSRSLGPVPQNEVDATVAKLKGYKHLFEAKATEDGTPLIAVYPGRNDFCILFRVKVPVSTSLLALHQPIYT
jgi:hypothetical protein